MLIAAKGWTKNWPDILDGVSADDVVEETLIAYYQSPNGLGWDSNRGTPLEDFLLGVCRNKLRDRIRRNSRISTADRTIIERLPDPANIEHSCVNRQFAMKVTALIRSGITNLAHNGAELLAVMDAVEALGDELVIKEMNKQIAALLRISVAEVEARKKRIRRLIRKIFKNGFDL
jgi:DNA-directed RNA polymerase specialized sigma24 family protein